MKKHLHSQANNTTNPPQKSTDNQSVEGNSLDDPLQNEVRVNSSLFSNSPYDKLICYTIEPFESYIRNRFELFKREFLSRLTQSQSPIDTHHLKVDLEYEESHLVDQILTFFNSDEYVLGHQQRINDRVEKIKLLTIELLNLERKVLLFDREDRNKNPQVIKLRAERGALEYENVFDGLQYKASERNKRNLLEYISTECTLLKLKIVNHK